MTRTISQRVDQAQRRLFLNRFLEILAWAWVVALLLAALWFLVGPYLIPSRRDYVLAGLLVCATLAAIFWSLRVAPSRLVAALTLDERFGLKERTTTVLTLAPDEAQSRVGQALVSDAEQQVAPLRVADRFPLTLPWKALASLPLGAILLVVLAILWNPDFSRGDSANDEPTTPPEARAKLEEKMKQLVAVKPPERKQGEPEVKAPDLAKIDADVEKFTRKPRDTKDDLRERMKDAMAIEDEIRRRQQDQAERADALKEQLKQADRLANKKREAPKGPADPAAAALARGDMQRAAEELERLGQQLDKAAAVERLKKKRDEAQDGEEKKRVQEQLDRLEKQPDLNDQDRANLEKQLEDLEQQLKELTRDKKDRLADLEKMAERGEIDKDQLDREKDQLDKDFEKLNDEDKKELEELAKQLGDCKQCLGKGQKAEAAKKLADAAKKCDGMCQNGQRAEMARRLAQMKEVRRLMGKGGAGVGAGRRPLGEDKGDTDKEEKWSPAEWGKGKIEVTGDGPKGGFKGPRRPGEMQAEIEEAAQQAPAAIDRQRLPPAARKMARDYFEKVRGSDKDKDR